MDRHDVVAPLQGTVVSVRATIGAAVEAGTAVVVIESMKMEHTVAAGAPGEVIAVAVAEGATVRAGDVLVGIAVADAGGAAATSSPGPVAAGERADLVEVIERHAVGLDAGRPDVVARRHASGRRTARENVDDLCDPGSFVEYGPLVIAAQRRRRSMEELIERQLELAVPMKAETDGVVLFFGGKGRLLGVNRGKREQGDENQDGCRVPAPRIH